MTTEEKKARIEWLKLKATELKKDIDYYNAMQTALKLVLNGTYGAMATPYFILFNNNVAGTITSQGRELTKTMDDVNMDYWYNKWHDDKEVHKNLCLKNITPIQKTEHVSVYGDTDSIFVSLKPCMDHCDWKNNFINPDVLNNAKNPFILVHGLEKVYFKNDKCIAELYYVEGSPTEDFIDSIIKCIDDNPNVNVIMDGKWITDKRLFNKVKNMGIKWNWSREVDFIHGFDKYRICDYFKQKLDEYAAGYGVVNKEDFELERISESIINIAKKKYIQNIVYEDGIPYDRLSYIYPKGVELVRSSTPAFAREKIIDIVKYLFSHPDTFNIKDLLKLVRNLRKEFELANIDDISMQSSCSNYENKVLNDKKLPLEFVSGAHFAVKCSAYYNYLLGKDIHSQSKYEFIKSGTKIKYYYCKDKKNNDTFAYIRGSFPYEFAPEVDYDIQFEKSILSPINSIIKTLGMPEITRRLSVVVDIFGANTKKIQESEPDVIEDQDSEIIEY